MKFSIGVFVGIFIASFWGLSLWVAFKPYFVLPAFLSSATFVIYFVSVIISNWHTFD